MRENCTYGSMRGIRRKTAKHVLRVAEGRAGVPDNKGRSALLYTPWSCRKKGLYEKEYIHNIRAISCGLAIMFC